ncbi:hypothetical protein GCM10025779_02790 [Arthrobacter cryoconiti]
MVGSVGDASFPSGYPPRRLYRRWLREAFEASFAPGYVKQSDPPQVLPSHRTIMDVGTVYGQDLRSNYT